ncbi:MAG: hypothetical protein HN413_08160 [Chloroflexi bacterium]|jgi:hypothetical protein|nr:hypothetical protein [Chloroflexota bacterium]
MRSSIVIAHHLACAARTNSGLSSTIARVCSPPGEQTNGNNVHSATSHTARALQLVQPERPTSTLRTRPDRRRS